MEQKEAEDKKPVRTQAQAPFVIERPEGAKCTYKAGDLDVLPNAVLQRIIGFNVRNARDLVMPQSICRRLYVVFHYNTHGMHSKLWPYLITCTWPHVNLDQLRLARWDRFYQIRMRKLKEAKKSNPLASAAHFIENCVTEDYSIPKHVPNTQGLHEGFEWDFKCQFVSELTRNGYVVNNGGKSSVITEYCKVCKKSVYVVKNEQSLKEHTTKGDCVIIDFEDQYRQEIPRPPPPTSAQNQFAQKMQVMGATAYRPPK